MAFITTTKQNHNTKESKEEIMELIQQTLTGFIPLTLIHPVCEDQSVFINIRYIIRLSE